MSKYYVYDREKLPHPILEGHADWIELYYKAWETAFNKVEYVDLPGWKNILTCMPGVGITWQWDSCIMTLITNYSNGTISALNNLDNLYRLRRESDGFMAMAYSINTGMPAYGERINPPLMAWAEWEHYLISGDSSRFADVLPALEGFYSFIENKRRRHSCDLYWFEDSGSSGMDNSPRSGYYASRLEGSDVCFIDLACQQALSATCIANICDTLGFEEKSKFYREENTRICSLINKFHWSEKSKWYFDFFQRSSKDTKVKFINSKTAAAFWTLISGAATSDKLDSVVKHMFDPNEFYTHIPFATLAKDDPNYDPTGGYWLGGVWPPTNYAAIKGLNKTGYRKLAREASVKFLNAMCNVYRKPEFKSIWECYSPEEDLPATRENGTYVRRDFVGWGGIAPITLLIEDIIGLEFNSQENCITFHLNSQEKCGIENMIFNSNNVSIVCSEFNLTEGKTTIETVCERPFDLILDADHLSKNIRLNVPAGKSKFFI